MVVKDLSVCYTGSDVGACSPKITAAERYGIKMTLSEKLVRLRKKSGRSQEEFAEKLDVSRQAVSKWESGQSLPEVDKILQISALYGVTTDYLLKDEMGEEPAPSAEAEEPAATPEDPTTSPNKWSDPEYLLKISKHEDEQPKTRRRRILDAFSSAYWLIMTTVYLIWSFHSGNWGWTWILWPIAGAAFAAIMAMAEVFFLIKDQ